MGATGQLLLVSGNVSTPQLLGNGSTVSWAGSVEGSYPGHIDTGGTTVIELDLIDVPVAYLTANYSCMFVNFSLANALESAPLQVCFAISISIYSIDSISINRIARGGT